MNLPPSNNLQELLRAYTPNDLQQAIAAEKQRRLTEQARIKVASGKALSLSEYIEQAWPVLHPMTPYVHGWAIDALCQHLEAITFNRFLDMGLENRFLANVPPGTMKSLAVSVFWPSWEWGPCRLSHLSQLATSYSDKIATRDTRKMRDLVESDWWQEHWGRGTDTNVFLTRRGETSFANNHSGWREAVAFSSLTGGRADRVIVDDPHSTEMAESEAERETTERIFRESLPSRVNDPKRSAIVIIMQRLHEQDVSGVILKMRMPYVHLMLPMEFEVERRCQTPIFIDPRTTKGELLFPGRFPAEVVARDKRDMTAFAWAGQMQQRPGQREGNMFKRFWFKRIGAAPVGTRWCRHWDLAATDEKFSQTSTAYTAGVLLGMDGVRNIYVGGCIAERLENVEPLILSTAETDRAKFFPYEISLPQDPGQAGKVQKKALSRLLTGYNFHFALETGDKGTRAEPFASQCEAGNVYIITNPNQPDPPWVESYIDVHCAFPGGAIKDHVDASSGAYARLLKPPRQQQGRPVPPTMSIYAR